MGPNKRLAVLLVWLLFILACDAGGGGPKKPSGRTERGGDSKEVQKSIIDELIKTGMFAKLDTASQPPQLVVTGEFQKNNREVKEKLLKIVFAYCHGSSGKSEPGDARVINLFDQDGKKIGEYGTAGLTAE